jgi:hypothetical protein
MSTHIAALLARLVRLSVVAILALSFLGVEIVHATPIFSVGAKEVVYSASKRKGKGASWPDGNFGVLSNGDGTYDFYAANSSKIKVTSGTLNDPAAKKIGTGKIYNIPKKTYGYVAGGPIYEDPASGARLMVYHAEIHYGSKYSSVLGLAASVDPKGLAFYDLGTIITPNIPVGQSQWSVDVGGGSFAIKDGQFNVYYRDYLADGSSSELAVARAPLADLVSNSLNGISTPFSKYYNGGWTEPGRGGKSSPLETGNPANWWSSVSYNEYLDQMVLVSSQWQAGGTRADLYLATSPDGVNWSTRQPLALDGGEQMYPTIIGTGADPQRTGQSFYVYYTDGSRWGSAQLARREVTFDPSISPVLQPPPGPDPTPMDWVLIGDYKDEFQGGGPATGWKYAWNPNGSLGNSANFSPLVWSESAQAYNTTGAATMVPGSTSHNDDYLHLTATGGHPGKPKYMPIAGYTIQEEDGAGLYRIADSSIQKLDGTLSTMEDGLEVLVYLNNTLVGPAANVSTSGLLTNFNRELGQLNVGDSIWVAINPLTTHYYDSFTGFDFSLQKGVPIAGEGMASMSLMAVGVPEPSSAALLLMAFGVGALRCRRRER